MNVAGRVILMLLGLVASWNAVAGQQTPGAVFVETDPAPFAFKGYAAHVRSRLARVPGMERWVVGVGLYRLDFPSAFRQVALDRPSDATRLALTHGYGVFLDRFVGADDDNGWFGGLQVARQVFNESDLAQPDARRRYSVTVLMPRGGYLHRAPGSHVYVEPWAGIEYLGIDHVPGRAGPLPKARLWLPYGALHFGIVF